MISGTRDNSDSSNYTGAGTDGDEAHDQKRKEFYEVTEHFIPAHNIPLSTFPWAEIPWLNQNETWNGIEYTRIL